jgi:UDP-N-acetylmuramate dehydrogenase
MHLATNVPLAPLTTLRLGGPALELAVLDDVRDFPAVAAHARSARLMPRVIGSGSNILASDDGYPGLVVRMATTGVRLARRDAAGRVLVTVQAGHQLQALVDEMLAEGLSGIECLTGIPGTTGATPAQNVGAYGQEVADTIASVRAWDWRESRETDLPPAQCEFGHRTSIFKHSQRWTILTVTFALTPSKLGPPLTYPAVAAAAGLSPGERTSLTETSAVVRSIRAKKGMLLDPADHDSRTAGSIFLSPVIPASAATDLRAVGAPVNDFPDGSTRVSASWLIGRAGFCLGQHITPGTRISGRHFTLVADDGATARSFAAAAAFVAERVRHHTGVALTAEPDLLGELPLYSKLTGCGPLHGSSGKNQRGHETSQPRCRCPGFKQALSPLIRGGQGLRAEPPSCRATAGNGDRRAARPGPSCS